MSERIEQLNNYKAELEKGLEEIKEEIKNVEKEIHFEGEDLGKMFKSILDNTCDCDNCACSDECDGEEFDGECDYETVVDCNLGDEIGIEIKECLECGDKVVLIQDLNDGEAVMLNRSELIAILSLMDVE